jgi:hypothetical protein
LQAWTDDPAFSGYPDAFDFTVAGPQGRLSPPIRLVAWQVAPSGEARDVSDVLRRFGMLNRNFNSETRGADKLYVQLEKRCPAAPEAGPNKRRAWGNACQLAFQEIATWPQTFPPGRSQVKISYQPSVGEYNDMTKELERPEFGVKEPYVAAGPTPGGKLVGRDLRPNKDASIRARYCVDEATQAALGRFLDKTDEPDAKDKGLNVRTLPISYVLETGKNWNGPIGRFRLIVDKISPDVLTAFCPPSAKKTSPTTFEWSAENFEPKGDLAVVFWLPDAMATAENERRLAVIDARRLKRRGRR